jgi:hypothetical protein
MPQPAYQQQGAPSRAGAAMPLPPGVVAVATSGTGESFGQTVNQAYRPSPMGGYAAPAGAAGSALYVVEGADKGKQIPLPQNGALILGRSPGGGGVALNDPGISSQHCSVTFDGSAFVVKDLGSRNGVFVNNQKVGRQVLSGGDLIVIGSTRLLVNLR